jgi:acetylglutamate kinase
MASHEQQARTLVEALPYIQKFTGKDRCGQIRRQRHGLTPELRRAVMSDIILLNLVGIRVVVVHGGGPEISAMLKKMGHESKFVDGLRYTDEETMDVVQQVLCGKVNKNLVAQINRLGGKGHRPVRHGRSPVSGGTAWMRNTVWWAKSPASTPSRWRTPC